MMNIVTSENDQLEMRLKQMGAKVRSIHGILCYVEFQIEETEVSYVYNINIKNQFYLQRIKPYPLGAGVFPTQKDIMKYIREDITQFQNAHNSKVFHKFVAVNSKLDKISHDMEDLFLEHNVPKEQLETIEKALDQIDEIINITKEQSPKIIIEKKPE